MCPFQDTSTYQEACALPASKAKLLERYRLTCGRVETGCEYLKDGEVAVIDGARGNDGGDGGAGGDGGNN